MPNIVTPLRLPAKPGRRRKAQPITENSLTVRLPQLCEMLNVGETKARELIRNRDVESFTIGKTRLISVASVEAWLERQLGNSSEAA